MNAQRLRDIEVELQANYFSLPKKLQMVFDFKILQGFSAEFDLNQILRASSAQNPNNVTLYVIMFTPNTCLQHFV